MKKGDILELEIEGFAFEGKGIAKIIKDPVDGKGETSKYVIFVHGAYPGDIVEAQLVKIKKSYAEAKTVKIISPSQFRIKARCKYFGVCGGCKQQDLDYEAQTKFKQEQVEQIFWKMGGFENLNSESIIPSNNIFFYRNKMEFSLADRRWLTQVEINTGEEIDRNFALGLHIPNIFDKVLDIDECFLQSNISNQILNFTRDFFKNRSISIYSSKTNSGYLRNLVIKQSHNTKDLMVNLVTFTDDDYMMNQYTGMIVKEIPQITTVINNINIKKALIATGDYEKVYYGNGYIFDSIGNYKFRISANSFFQTNSLQAEKLYQTAMDFAGLTGREIVYDLYSGAGTISIFVSSKAQQVFGFETVESAVSDAEENKKLNKIENVNFIRADLYKPFLPEVEEKQIPKPDVVILDPPRNGMHTNTVDDVIKLSPRTIVYVSCNPATQVRDIKLFCASGYKLVKIRPVDMFPHTYHIENVALLEKENR